MFGKKDQSLAKIRCLLGLHLLLLTFFPCLIATFVVDTSSLFCLTIFVLYQLKDFDMKKRYLITISLLAIFSLFAYTFLFHVQYHTLSTPGQTAEQLLTGGNTAELQLLHYCLDFLRNILPTI